MLISGAFALNNELIVIESGISTGAVDIEIKEYNEESQPFDRDGARVMPGEEISLIPKINNLGIDCYLRAKIEYIIDGESFPEIDYIDGNYSSWTKKGNYYYYDSVFSKKGSIDLFNKVKIPNLSSDYNNKKVVLNIVIEAVQAKNFDGNWDDININKAINRTYDIDYDGESSIIYENATNNHITLDNKFFAKLGNILPGDKITGNISILNKSKSENEYYFTIDYDHLANEDLVLLKKLKLIVTKQDGEVIVNSNLGNEAKYVLGKYNSGQGENFKIEVSLPKNTENNLSKLYTKIKWNFSYKNLSEDSDSVIINPKTGDINVNLYIIVFILSTIGLIIDMLLWKRENQNKRRVIYEKK